MIDDLILLLLPHKARNPDALEDIYTTGQADAALWASRT